MQTQLDDIRTLISEFRISKPIIAKKMAMNENTFKLKLSSNFPQYNFNFEELEKLRIVINELKHLTEKASVRNFDKVSA